MIKIIKYYISSGNFGTYKMRFKNIPKLVAIAFNYCADLYLKDENDKIRYIYCDQEDKETNEKLLKSFNIELKYDENYLDYEFMPFYKGENVFSKYSKIDIEEVGKEVK